MRVISAGMLAGVMIILGVALCARQIMKPVGVPFVSWFAVGFAVVAPLIAAAVDRARPDATTRRPGAPSPAFSRHLVAYANLEAAGYPVLLVVNGQKAMPAFGRQLDDNQVAAVVNYIRANFGNAYTDRVSTDDVKAARQ